MEPCSAIPRFQTVRDLIHSTYPYLTVSVPPATLAYFHFILNRTLRYKKVHESIPAHYFREGFFLGHSGIGLFASSDIVADVAASRHRRWLIDRKFLFILKNNQRTITDYCINLYGLLYFAMSMHRSIKDRLDLTGDEFESIDRDWAKLRRDYSEAVRYWDSVNFPTKERRARLGIEHVRAVLTEELETCKAKQAEHVKKQDARRAKKPQITGADFLREMHRACEGTDIEIGQMKVSTKQEVNAKRKGIFNVWARELDVDGTGLRAFCEAFVSAWPRIYNRLETKNGAALAMSRTVLDLEKLFIHRMDLFTRIREATSWTGRSKSRSKESRSIVS